MDTLNQPSSNQNQPSTEQQQSVPLNSSLHSKTFLLVAGAIALMAISAVGGYFLGANKQSQSSQPPAQPSQSLPTPTPTPTPTPVAIPTVDPSITANWKLFNPPNKGYSFKYPPDWTFQSPSEGCGPLWYAPNSKTIWISVCGTYINPDETPENMANRPRGLGVTQVKKVPIMINGQMAIKREFQLEDGYEIDVYVGQVKETTIFAGRHGQPDKTQLTSGTLTIHLFVLNQSKIQETTSIFDQILSTFKFTN